MILLLIFIIVLIGLLTNYKRTVLLYAPFKLILLNYLDLFANFGLSAAISIIILIMYLTRYPSSSGILWRTYPLKIATILLSLSIIAPALSRTFYPKAVICSIFETLPFVFVLYSLIQDKKDIQLILKGLGVVSIIMLINAFLEFGGVNIMGDFYRSNFREGMFYVDADADYLRGLRLHSMFAHSIVFGTVCAMLAYIYAFIYTNYGSNKQYLLLFIALVTFMVLSNSRTPILCFVVLVVPFLIKRNAFSFNHVLMIIALFSGIFIFSSYLSEVFSSLFGESDEIGGSSIEMRLIQLETVLYIVNQSPLFGVGDSIDITRFQDQLLGAESVWFQKLIHNGYFGAISYLILYVEIIVKSRHLKYFKYIIFLSFGWLVANTSSNMSGMDDYCLLLLFVILYKLSIIEKNCEEKLYSL